MKRITTDEFKENSITKHGNFYDYSLTVYVNSRTKIKIICPVHGEFFQNPRSHLQGSGCLKCGHNRTSSKKTLTTLSFKEKSNKIHKNKYDYSLVEYIDAHFKVKIICPMHGIFEQAPYSHLQGFGCRLCSQPQYYKRNIPVYDLYKPQLSPYNIECRKNADDINILEVKCVYCGKWYIPTLTSVLRKLMSIRGKARGDNNLYCSDGCKYQCPTYQQKYWPKGFKINSSREVQPILRKMVFDRDNFECQRCGGINDLHCHHITGVELNPIESADIDNCITLCVTCHNKVHNENGCHYSDMKRRPCEV